MKVEQFLTLPELASPSNPDLRRLTLSSEQVDAYFEDRFQELKMEDLDRLLQAFGISKNNLHILFSNDKSGFLVMDAPVIGGNVELDNASGVLTWSFDPESKKKSISVSGIRGSKQKTIIAAKYEEYHTDPQIVYRTARSNMVDEPASFMSPKEDGYRLVSYDVGLMEKPGDRDIHLVDIRQAPVSGLITERMIQVTGNKYKYHIPTGIGDIVSKDHVLSSVPNKLPLKAK